MKQEMPQIGTQEFNDLASAFFGGKPKPKQETLEEAALKLYPINFIIDYDENKEKRDIWIEGAKWKVQQNNNKIMKQTAVEWLESEILKPNISMHKILEQAKELEKQQIIEAYSEGMGHYGDANSSSCAEKYYKEKFNK